MRWPVAGYSFKNYEMIRYTLFVMAGLCLVIAKAQDRYMVFFKDKAGSPYTITAPSGFLSERAILRRQSQGIAVTEEDLPVNQSYLQALKGEGADVFFTSRWLNGALVQMNDEQKLAVSTLPMVFGIELVGPGAPLSREQREEPIPDEFLPLTSIGADPSLQLGLLGVDRMHEDGYSGAGMYIAVMDAGFPGVNVYEPFEHLFQESRILAGVDYIRNSGNPYQYNGHGSSVLSLMAGKTEEIMQGTAPDASYFLFVTEDVSSEYRIEEYNLLFATEYADSAGVDVINVSLGYSTFNDASMDYNYEDLDGQTTVSAKVAQGAAARGIVFVASAGNEGTGSWKYIVTPADAKDVLAVGSVTSTLDKSAFSSFGPSSDLRVKPDISALGSGAVIFSGSELRSGSGTSYSAPEVAGFVACIWQAHPDWTAAELRDSVKISGHQSEQPDNLLGYGVPNYYRINHIVLDADEGLSGIEVYPNPITEGILHIALGTSIPHLQITLLDSQGQQIMSSQGKETLETIDLDLSSVKSGIYFLVLRTRTHLQTVKIVRP